MNLKSPMNLPKDLKTESKPIFTSKTAAASALLAVLSFIPGAREFFADEPQMAMLIVAAVGLILRVVTKGKVTLT